MLKKYLASEDSIAKLGKNFLTSWRPDTFTFINPSVSNPNNGQTHSNNSSANCQFGNLM